jgi:hypothetical protein
MSSRPDAGQPDPGGQVLRLLRDRVRAGSRPGQRADGHRIVLAIEGGGMRGTITAGMALALQEAGREAVASLPAVPVTA